MFLENLSAVILTVVPTAAKPERFSHLVQNSEHELTREYVAFAARRDIKTDGWNRLRSCGAGAVKGSKVRDRNIAGTRSTTSADDGARWFRLRQSDRGGRAVFSRGDGQQRARDFGLTDVLVIGRPLAQRYVDGPFHNEPTDLPATASDTPQELKRDGTCRQIFEAAPATPQT